MLSRKTLAADTIERDSSVKLLISQFFGAIYFHPEVPTPIKCDLCEGEPLCVKWCPTKALKYTPLTEVGDEKRMDFARGIAEGSK